MENKFKFNKSHFRYYIHVLLVPYCEYRPRSNTMLLVLGTGLRLPNLLLLFRVILSPIVIITKSVFTTFSICSCLI